MDNPLKKGVNKPDKEQKFTPKFVRERYDAGKRETLKEVREYRLNRSYIMGDQWLWWNKSQDRPETLPKDADRVQATFDRLLMNSTTIMGKALQKQLAFDANPTAADDATILGARTAKSIAESTRDSHDWESKRREHFWATWEGAVSAVAVDWDPTAAREIAENVYEGDTVESVLNISEFVVEPGARYAETARWWIKAQAMPPEEVQARFDLPEKPPADANTAITNLPSTQGGEITPMTLVLTYYERPNRLCREGRVAVVVDSKFVQGPKAWPFPFKDHLNIAISIETPIAGKWTGKTRLSTARPVQALLNTTMSAIIEHMKLVGNARLMIPESSVDTVNQLSDEPGEPLIYADGGTQPNYLNPPQMPSWEIELPTTLMTQIDDIMGVPAISRGAGGLNAPDSGYGLSILAEQADTPVGLLVKGDCSTWGKVSTMCLQLFEQNVTESRQAIVSTPSSAPETIKWTGKDLMGQTHITVPVDSVLPRSRAAQQQWAETMLDKGLITTLAQLATIGELPGRDDIIQAVEPDIAKAKRENEAFAAGRVLLVAEFDDDEKHIGQHLNFAKSPRFEAMSKEQQQAFLDHKKAHEVQAAHKMGNATMRGNIAPALASVPRADGGPTIDPSVLPPDPGLQTPALPPGAVPPGAPQPVALQAPPQEAA